MHYNASRNSAPNDPTRPIFLPPQSKRPPSLVRRLLLEDPHPSRPRNSINLHTHPDPHRSARPRPFPSPSTTPRRPQYSDAHHRGIARAAGANPTPPALLLRALVAHLRSPRTSPLPARFLPMSGEAQEDDDGRRVEYEFSADGEDVSA